MAWLSCCPYAVLRSREAHDLCRWIMWFDKNSIAVRLPRITIGHVRLIEAYQLGRATAENERQDQKR
jgi:hypothetical protein